MLLNAKSDKLQFCAQQLCQEREHTGGFSLALCMSEWEDKKIC